MSRSIKRGLLVLAVLGAARLVSSQGFERRPLGEIEFFGYKGINVEAARSALPFHEGDMFPPGDGDLSRLKPDVEDRVERAIGRRPTDVSFVCCDDRQNWMAYIGLPGATNRPVAFNPTPNKAASLPADLVKLHGEIDKGLMAAVMSGHAKEDRLQGFSLIEDPPLRAKQMELRAYALRHEALIIDVLTTSSDAKQREMAAASLGYARASKRQVAVLVRACLDPDDGVRNNAVRALAVLAPARADLARTIPLRPFVDLMTSGSWSDHNKAVALLLSLTASRDAAVLKALRAGALDNLIEMARWRSSGHAFPALIVVGRIGGIEEPRLQQLAAQGRVDDIIAAATNAR